MSSGVGFDTGYKAPAGGSVGAYKSKKGSAAYGRNSRQTAAYGDDRTLRASQTTSNAGAGAGTTPTKDCKELITGKLYFSKASSKPFDSQQCKVINIDNAYLYEGYNSDFGPLTLNFVHKFVKEIDNMFGKYSKVIHHCSPSYKAEANGTFLMGCYLIISQKWSIKQISDAFGGSYLNSLRPFRDAGVGPDDFPLTVIDCIKGMERAVQLNWYSKGGFDCFEFEQMLKHGDLSWVVPD
mmetsp:Transcript_1294/g.1743  ORF Transcript_1294/g.1743 Transcript_1294/m.1743 type:complete len:238 (-) Transcript_1294:2041-2754(-)|eukprot:CAMPEP_0185584720 /NCGR_PEP_ID=MMETSP0434-20130131/33900_1 /TAXON_ID=626734 ORGANISM="Favella taraikaensis, Strain Fe Narragansett Bay" /NCGR_SAMPLE_ID=MMETSP0434 /ASSEMBLY_ACC=CAM_ASM_000379 /LENGTH=237 /DNA_ID=CAMNT_0028204649 /DNA_START=652 /DNA_END=1365 /DNA_ORIENTATION=+